MTLSLLPSSALASDQNDSGATAGAVVEALQTAQTQENQSEAEPLTASTNDSDQNDEVTTYATTSDLTTSECDPCHSILYTYSTTVDSGTIRYVSQHPSSKYFQGVKYWGEKPIKEKKTKWLCKSADVSMALSYLGVDMLPKDIMGICSDNKCLNRDWGTTKHCKNLATSDTKKNFLLAVDNYLNGGGVYSPPIIRLENEAYKKSGQHFVVVLSRKDSSTYQILDPYQDKIWDLTVEGDTLKYYYGAERTSPITEVYQYYLEQETAIKDASKPQTMKEGSIFAPTGVLYGDQTITKVTVGCYDMEGTAQECCYQTAKPNSVGYDLANMNNKLKFSDLTPGVYKYVVQATVNGTQKTYLSKYFVVLSTGKTVNNATFYFDNRSDIKYCAVPTGESNGNNVDMRVTRNTESAYMRLRAKYVSDGYYTLQILGSGKYLTVYKSANVSGTRMIQNSMVKRDGQYWQILPTGNGNYYLVPKCATGCCLTLTDATATEGVKMQIKTANHKTPKSWLLRYVRPLITTTRNTTQGVQLKWGAITGASGYRIYRKATSATSWTRVKTITSGSTTSWTDADLSNGTLYDYTMRAVYDKKVSPSCPAKNILRLNALGIKTLKNPSQQKITLTWNANTKADGYQICYATAENFQNNKTVTVAGKKNLSKELVGLTKGKTYYLKVRAYKTVSGEKYYSGWSTPKSLKIVR